MTSGGAWTRELLAELRAGCYRPAAWRLFFARSFARAAETRTRRSREHRQLHALAALGFVGWTAVAANGEPWLALAGFGWLLLLLLMVDWHLGMLEDDDGRPLHGLGAANLLSIGRGALVPALLATHASVVIALLVLAGASDVIDGPLARTRGTVTRLGRFIDGGVDAIVLIAAAIAAARLGLLPWWAAVLVLARHLLQWSALAFAYFHGVATVRAASARMPGVVLFAGLLLALLQVRPAAALVALAALAGIAVLALSAVWTLRSQAEVA